MPARSCRGAGPGPCGRLFGAAVWRGLPPGLHYPALWPFARADRWPVREVKSVISGAADEYPVYKVLQKMGDSHGTIEHRVKRYVSGLGTVA